MQISHPCQVGTFVAKLQMEMVFATSLVDLQPTKGSPSCASLVPIALRGSLHTQSLPLYSHFTCILLHGGLMQLHHVIHIRNNVMWD